MTRLVVVLLLALSLSPTAQAFTRETPSVRLGVQPTSSGAQSASISIPTGTTNAVISFYFASISTNQAPTSVSLDGHSATKKVSDEGAGVMAIAMYTVSGMSTGASKTLAWTNGTGYTVLDVAVEFRDSTPTYGATDFDDCNSCSTLSSAALANSSGDELLCAYGLNGAGSISGVGAGQTKEDESVGYSIYGFTSATGSGSATAESFSQTGGGIFGFNCLVITFSAASAPTFSAGPAYATVSNTQISATFTASAAGQTYYCALYLQGASTPTAAQVAAGTNAHSSVASGTTTGSSETHNITGTDSPTLPKYDPYCVLSNGTFSSVPTTSTTSTSAPTGYQYVTTSAVTATGSEPKAYNDADLITLGYDTQTANFTVGSVVVDATSGAWGYIRLDSDGGPSGTLTIDKRSGTFADNDVLYDQGGGAALVNGSESAYTSWAANDILVIPLTTTPSGASLAVNSSGQFVYTAAGRQSAVNGLVYHVASAAYLSLPLDAWFNNTAPHCQTPQTITYRNGVAIDYDVSSLCADADNDTLGYARITSLPHGATINAATGHITGTVDTDATTAASIIVYDSSANDYTTQSVTFIVKTEWAMPDCSGLAAGVCGSLILATTNGTALLSFSSQCSGTISNGNVISQSPAAGVFISPGDTVSITESVGNICSVRSPDCVSAPTTLAACEALYNSAFSSLINFTPSSRCNDSLAAGYVISTSPKANSQIPPNSNVGIVESLGTCSTASKSMVNCIARTLVDCQGLVEAQFGNAVTILQQSVPCASGYTSGSIFSQAPAAGKKTKTPATLNVRYCL